jgi:hypothetical protein
MLLDASDRLIGVMALDITEGGQIQAVTGVSDPDKLQHLAPLADLAQLGARDRRGGGDGGPAGEPTGEPE